MACESCITIPTNDSNAKQQKNYLLENGSNQVYISKSLSTSTNKNQGQVTKKKKKLNLVLLIVYYNPQMTISVSYTHLDVYKRQT